MNIYDSPLLHLSRLCPCEFHLLAIYFSQFTRFTRLDHFSIHFLYNVSVMYVDLPFRSSLLASLLFVRFVISVEWFNSGMNIGLPLFCVNSKELYISSLQILVAFIHFTNAFSENRIVSNADLSSPTLILRWIISFLQLFLYSFMRKKINIKFPFLPLFRYLNLFLVYI